MIYYTILIINGLLFFSRLKSRIIPVISLIGLGFLAGSADIYKINDAVVYQNAYNALAVGAPGTDKRFEWLYTATEKGAQLLGLNFTDFRFYFLMSVFVLIATALVYVTPRPSLFVFLFAIFPFFSEITQIRSFAMLAVMMWALIFSAKSGKKWQIVSFLTMLLASGFHSTGYLFLLVFVVRKFSIRKIVNYSVRSVVVLVLVGVAIRLFATNLFQVFLGALLNLIGRENMGSDSTVNAYSAGLGSSFFPVLIMILIYVLVLFVTAKLYFSKSIEGPDGSLLSVLLISEIVMIVGIPLMFMSVNYQRILRFGIEMGYLFFAIYSGKYVTIISNGKVKLLPIYMSLLMVISVLIALLVFDGGVISGPFADTIPYFINSVSISQ